LSLFYFQSAFSVGPQAPRIQPMILVLYK